MAEHGAGPLIRTLHLITVAAGSAAERGLPRDAVEQVLDVVARELGRLGDRGGLPADDRGDLAALARRIAELRTTSPHG